MSTEITNNYIEEYTTQEKLQILADAAKYDVACTSSGSDRRGKKGELGNAAACGICHSFASDGRCISLLDRKSTRLNSSHANESRMPSSA